MIRNWFFKHQFKLDILSLLYLCIAKGIISSCALYLFPNKAFKFLKFFKINAWNGSSGLLDISKNLETVNNLLKCIFYFFLKMENMWCCHLVNSRSGTLDQKMDLKLTNAELNTDLQVRSCS